MKCIQCGTDLSNKTQVVSGESVLCQPCDFTNKEIERIIELFDFERVLMIRNALSRHIEAECNRRIAEIRAKERR